MLTRKKKYLQVALNSSLDEARKIITQLPVSDRIIIEAGTPLLKNYGASAIKSLKSWWQDRNYIADKSSVSQPRTIKEFYQTVKDFQPQSVHKENEIQSSYIVADYKAMDRGSTEVDIAASSGADAITVLGQAPIETINSLIEECNKNNIDSIIDMMNVEKPYQVLRKLKKLPQVVMLHRGVDEAKLGLKPFPIHMINKVKGAFNVLVALGGGDTIREVQSAVFNGADIVMVWKDFYEVQDNTAEIAQEFLKKIK